MEIFAKAGFSNLWLLINSSRGLPPPSHLSWNLGVILDLSMLSPAGISPVTQVPFHAGFSRILPSQRQLVQHPWLLLPSHIFRGGRRDKAIFGHLFRELGEQGVTLDSAAAFITSASVYLPGAACSQILRGPGSGTAQILEALSFSHQNWGCWCQCNGKCFFLG